MNETYLKHKKQQLKSIESLEQYLEVLNNSSMLDEVTYEKIKIACSNFIAKCLISIRDHDVSVSEEFLETYKNFMFDVNPIDVGPENLPPQKKWQEVEEEPSYNELERNRLQEEMKKLECPYDSGKIKHFKDWD